MKQFVIHLENSNALAEIGKMLGQYKIDIVSMAGTTAFGVCTAVLFTDDEEGTINVLRQLSIPFSTQDILVASIPDEPGSFGHFTQLFKDHSIKLLSFYILRFTGKNADIAFSVDETDFEKAQSFLDVSGFIQSVESQKKKK
ncbi:MAG: hypothetical protein JSV04_15070 [Candidatus Heimdallarchaeota archaeon]|nr:MAG: hypothetical protein JSV04_15070 [Candidatus Heimdallarchaeota archaeon]